MNATWLLAVPLASLVTLGLLEGLQGLIHAGDGTGPPAAQPRALRAIHLQGLPAPRRDEARRPELPPRPLPAAPPPPMAATPPRPAAAVARASEMPRVPTAGRLDLPLELGAGVAIPEAATSGTCCLEGAREEPVVPLIRVPPRYPPRARRRRQEGWIRLEFTVTTSGDVTGVAVLDAEPEGVWDEAAREALARWRFRPRTVDGEAVEARVTQTLQFRISGD